MKKLILFLALAAAPAFAAISATTEWDVGPSGSNNNGGGFDTAATGTDRSQQDAAYIAFTDLVIGGTTTQATSSAHPFDATSPGNIVNTVSGSGCTVQRAQIVSVSGSTATFDKSLGTAASTCTANLGGRLATPAGILNTSNVWTSGNKVHIKAGTYTTTTSISIDSSNGPLYVIGYNTTHLDASATRPLITTATNSTKLFTLLGGNKALHFINLDLSNTAATRADGFWVSTGGTYPQLILENCKLDGFATGVNGDNGVGYVFSLVVASATEIKNSTGQGITNYQNPIHLTRGTRIHDNTGDGVKGVTNGASVFCNGAMVDHNGGKGMNLAGSITVSLENCDVVSNTGDGIATSGTAYGVYAILTNSILYGNGGWAWKSTNAQVLFGYTRNAFGSNTSGNLNNLTAPGVMTSDLTLTASPFVSSSNFALNSTVGGGALLKQAALPSVYPSGGTGYLDVGAIQTSGAPGGSSGAFAWAN